MPIRPVFFIHQLLDEPSRLLNTPHTQSEYPIEHLRATCDVPPLLTQPPPTAAARLWRWHAYLHIVSVLLDGRNHGVHRLPAHFFAHVTLLRSKAEVSVRRHNAAAHAQCRMSRQRKDRRCAGGSWGALGVRVPDLDEPVIHPLDHSLHLRIGQQR
jgi:hypothetical protein